MSSDQGIVDLEHTGVKMLAQRLREEIGLSQPVEQREGDRSSSEYTLGAFHEAMFTSAPFGSCLSRTPSMNFEWATDESRLRTEMVEERLHADEYGANLHPADFFPDPLAHTHSPSSTLSVTGVEEEQAEIREVGREARATFFILPINTPLGNVRAAADAYVRKYCRLQDTASLERKVQEEKKYFFFNCALQVTLDHINEHIRSSLNFNSSSPSRPFTFDIEGKSVMKGVASLIEDLITDPDLRGLSTFLPLPEKGEMMKKILYRAFDLVPKLLKYTRGRTNKSRFFTLHVHDVYSLSDSSSLSALEAASAALLFSE
uniref:Uncharacterized protein n=1 Tax=Palpitomonas bilix TaxID=652834 RepID=A0A7S3CV03_9EUKA|mmetsp:Transcript_10332/g.27089  ORF Transcript_10332/g.27089 Transcript_10332/m.27089 type:complete len:317 (+) Transcript_10332:117-1067(+)